MLFGKRVISLCLSITMILGLLPLNVMAADEKLFADENESLSIMATAKETVTVKENEEKPIEPVPIDPVYKSLSILTDDLTVDRDYEQICNVTISNPAGKEAKQFYLEAENVYSDLSYQFIGNGSVDNPMFIAPGESINVSLSVFAQNAEKDTYYIPIAAHVLANGEYEEDSKQSITLNCELPMLDLHWNLDSISETSLSQSYTITNNGDKLTDLAVTVSNELKDYVSFTPIISNYELEKNSKVQFTVYPDLAKMKNEGIDKLKGNLIAVCAGKVSEWSCNFDAKGKKITVTTMGKLGLKQDGNPFTKFKVDEDSVAFKYNNGTGYVDINDNLGLEDVISDEGIFNIENDMQIDLGINNPISVTSTIKSFPVDDSTEKSMETEFKELDNGSIELILRNIISVNEFWEYFNALMVDKKNLIVTKNHLSSMHITENLDDKAKIGTELVITFNDLMDATKDLELPGAIGGNKAIGVLGYIYDIYSITDDARKTTNVFHDPRLSNDLKQKYLTYNLSKIIVTELQWANSLFVPVPANLIINAGLYLFSKYLDGKQEALLDNAYSEIYAQILGKQCTNRGSITAKFHAPDYSNSSTKPSIHASSRMSGNGYVNKQDTNYDMTLNGKPAGTTQNSGLTDVLMTEIPTDNLILGKENTIVFDYDTSPGSHSVSTDTEITLMYPNDTEIAYIGEPDDLQDVRTKPDFAIYSENVYADDPVIGEQTALHFNVYNTGSRGGWFKITCTDSDTGKIFYQKENHYLSAFSSEQLQIAWTPEKNNTNFLINLENTSVGLEERDKYASGSGERDDRNNKAEKTILARQREIPMIKSTSADGIYENQPFSVIVDVEQCKDLESTAFKYENKEIRAESTGSGQARRYCLYFEEGLPNGDYEVEAEFQYRKSAAAMATTSEKVRFTVRQQIWTVPDISVNSNVTLLYGENFEFSVYDIDNLTRTEIVIDSGTNIKGQPLQSNSDKLKYSIDMSGYTAGEHAVSIMVYYTGRDGSELAEKIAITVTLLSEAESYYSFSVPENIVEASPKFSVYREAHKKTDVTFEKTLTGYRFLKTLDMVDDQSDYSLVVSYNSGVIVKNLGAADGVIDQSGCHTLTAIKSAKDEITYAAITRLPGAPGSVTIPVSLEKPLTLSQGEYELTVHGAVDGVSFYQKIDIDMTAKDQVIDLSKFALIYYLDVTKSGASADKYNVSLYIHGDYGWDSYSMTKDSNNENNMLKCYNSSEWVLSRAEKSTQVYLLAYSDTEVYFIQIKDTTKGVTPVLVELEPDSNTIVLDRSALNEVNLLSINKDLKVSNVHINWNELSLSLYGDTVYIPDGKYAFQVTLTDDVQTFMSNSTVTIDKDCSVTVGADINATYSDIVVDWSELYDSKATINCYNNSENWRSIIDVSSGSKVKALNGLCIFNICLSCTGIPINFTRELAVGENNDCITIGNKLTGDFSASFADEYQIEDSIQFSIKDVKDSYGNNLSTYYFDSPLSGQVIYKNVENSEKIFTVPINEYSLYDISANLPAEPGEYSVSAILTFNPPKEELTYSVAVNGSYAPVTGAGKYAAGEIVTISAGKRSNYDFLGWTSSDVTINNLSGETSTFIMPAMDVSVTAQWEYHKGNNGGGGGSIITPIPNPIPVQRSINDCQIVISPETFLYDGKEKMPSVLVKDGSKTLSINQHYTVEYKDNIYPGMAKVIITGKGSYSGSATKTFVITQEIIEVTGITLNKENLIMRLGDSEILTALVLPANANDKKVMWNSSNTTVATVDGNGRVDAKAKGTADIIARTANGKEAACKVTVLTTPEPNIKMEARKITLSKKNYVYNGKARKPAVTVLDSNGNKISSTNYIVFYSNNVKVGKAAVTVKLKNAYTGTFKKNFTIKPRGTKISSVKAKTKGFTVQWSKRKAQTTAYQIQYSTSKKFTAKTTKTKTVKNLAVTKFSVKKLKANKKYYVRVRTYKTKNKKKYRSAWSGIKSVKTKK